jgi:hypothetical protein
LSGRYRSRRRRRRRKMDRMIRRDWGKKQQESWINIGLIMGWGLAVMEMVRGDIEGGGGGGGGGGRLRNAGGEKGGRRKMVAREAAGDGDGAGGS